MSTTRQGNPYDYAGVETFKEDTESNMKWLAVRVHLVPDHRYEFVNAVVEFWKTKDYITDKQINAILPAYRDLQDLELTKTTSHRTMQEYEDIQKAGEDRLKELDGSPKFR